MSPATFSKASFALRFVLAMAVVMSFVTAYQRPAAASPAPVPQPRVASRGAPPDDRDITASQKADLSAARRIARYAVNRKTKVMSYRKADLNDKGRVTARRKMAAGFLFAGGKVTNISKAELKRVKRYIPRRPRPCSECVVAMIQKCNGVSKSYTGINGSRYWNQVWLDSCRTNEIILALSSAAAAAGVLAVIVPWAALAAATAAILVLGAEYLSYCQGNSDVSAVIINDHWHVVWCESQ